MNDIYSIDVSRMHHKQPKDTEVAAAESIKHNVTGLRLTVLHCLDRNGPCTGEKVADLADEWLYSIKPRITELCRMGMVEDTGQRFINKRNRKEIVWDITDKGRKQIA